MRHELTFNVLVVESQHLLKLQSGKITKKYPVLSQLNALVRYVVSHQRAPSVTNAAWVVPGPAGEAPHHLAAVWERSYF